MRGARSVLACAVVFAGLPLAGQAPRPLLVRHASLWTPNGVLHDHELLIRNGRVAARGAAGTLAQPKDARVLDAGGDTLLPGLIDAHVHLVSGVRLPAEFGGDARARVAAKQLLRSGVTSGRVHLWDLPSAASFRGESQEDAFAGPRLQFGGPALFGGRPDWNAERGNAWGVQGPDDARAKLQRLAQAGIGWVGLHDLQRFQPGELEAIAAEARRLKLRLLAGGDRVAEVERALAIGVDSVEYLDRSDAPAYPDELIAKARQWGSELFFVPIVGFPHRFVAYRQGRTDVDAKHLTEFLPADVASAAARALKEDQTAEIPNAPKWTDVPPALPQKFRQLRGAGLQLVTGSDCGSPAHAQADAIWWELETWRQLGVPPHEIVRAATATAAALLGEPDAGHLGLGARGDFVLLRGGLDGGPLGVERVRAVAKAGVLFVNDGRWQP